MLKDKRRIKIDDLYEMNIASDPQISPDGRLIAYVVKTVNKEDDTKYNNHIYVVRADGSKGPIQFTNLGESEINPRWSPDGNFLAFNAKNKEYSQIYKQPIDGGAALLVTNNDFNTGAPIWSPDGTKIAFTAKVFPEGYQKKDSDVRYITDLRYKANGIGFLDAKVNQIHMIDLTNNESKQLTSGIFDCNNPAWSPCSKYIAFNSNRTEDHHYNHFSDIYTVSLDGELNKVTKTDGRYISPSYSPNGGYLAYSGHQLKYSTATISNIYIHKLDQEHAFILEPELDTDPEHDVGSDVVRSPKSGFFWTKDSDALTFLASLHGKTAIYKKSLDEDSKLVKISDGDETIYAMSYCQEADTYAALRSSMVDICDVYLVDNKGKKEQITNLNKKLLREVYVSSPEQFTYNAEGFEIEGWIMKPYEFEEDKKYPTILHIHGGPHSAYGHIFLNEMQLLAAEGYVVVFVNPQGSSTYGQEFLIQTHHDLGGKDYRSLMAATKYVNENYNYVDVSNWGVTGGSYGGYMTNWMISQTDFFKAAVAARSTCNRHSAFGQGDVGYFKSIFEYPGTPWDNPEFYLRVSPISYADKVNTPLLLIHSEEDYRCPISQAEEFFTALKWQKKIVAMVRFPNENHDLPRSGQPSHRKERLSYIIDWFKEYLPVN